MKRARRTEHAIYRDSLEARAALVQGREAWERHWGGPEQGRQAWAVLAPEYLDDEALAAIGDPYWSYPDGLEYDEPDPRLPQGYHDPEA